MNPDFFETLISNEISEQKKTISTFLFDSNPKNDHLLTQKEIEMMDSSEIIQDPRKDILLNIYASHGKEKSSSHHYLQKPRFCGTIYNKKTYAAMCNSDYQSSKIYSSLLEPPSLWLTPSMGASADYINGSFHFPYFLSGNNSNLASKTINRKKLSSSYYMMVCAQIAAKQILFEKNGGKPFDDIFFDFKFLLDATTQELVDALLGKTNFHGKEYVPRKITVEQTKELLHAWIQVYIFQKNEFINILNYYLYAGYVVSITSGHGGLHIQQSLPTHPSKWTPSFKQYQTSTSTKKTTTVTTTAITKSSSSTISSQNKSTIIEKMDLISSSSCCYKKEEKKEEEKEEEKEGKTESFDYMKDFNDFIEFNQTSGNTNTANQSQEDEFDFFLD